MSRFSISFPASSGGTLLVRSGRRGAVRLTRDEYGFRSGLTLSRHEAVYMHTALGAFLDLSSSSSSSSGQATDADYEEVH